MRFIRLARRAAIADMASLCAFLALIVGCLSSAGVAEAATKYWDLNGVTAGAGTTPTGTWDTTTSNWTTNSAGTAATTTWAGFDDAVFSAGADATGSFTVTVSGTQSANSISVEEGTVLITGGTINKGSPTLGPVFSVASGLTATINSNITSTTFGFHKTGAGTLELGGNVTYNGTGTAEDNWLRINAGTLRVTSGTHSNNALIVMGRSGDTGAQTFAQSGGTFTQAATLFLGNASGQGANILNFSGGTFDAAGQVVAFSDREATSMAISGTADVRLGAVTANGQSGTASRAAIIDLNGGTLTATSFSNTGTNGGTFTFNFNGGTLKAAASGTLLNSNLTAANVSAGGAIIDSNGFNPTIDEPLLANGGGLTKEGTGILTLNGTNTYTGGTTVNGGALTLATGGSAGAIRGTLTINSAGTVNTTAANALGFGAGTKINTLNIAGGLLNNTAVGDQGWGMSINLTGGTLQSNGGTSSAVATQLFSFGGIAAGTGTVVNSLASGTTSTISGRINLRENNPGNIVAFDVQNGGATVDLLVSAAITEAAAGYGISKAGAGRMDLTGANFYTGTTTVSDGTLTLGTGGLIANTSAISIASGAVLNLSGNANNQIQGGAVSPSLTITGGTLRATTAFAHTLYATTITLNNGTMDSTGGTGPANDNAVGQFGAYYVGTSRTITANGAINTLSGNGKIGIAGTQTLTLNTPLATDALLVSTVLGVGNSGTLGGLAKSGAGTVTLTAAPAFTGNTALNAGVLQVGDGVGSTSWTYGGTFSGAGNLTIASNSTLTINNAGNNQLSRTAGSSLTINGTLTVANLSANTMDATGALTMNNGAITTSGAGNATFGALYFNGIVQRTLIANGASNTISGTNVIGLANNAVLTLNTPLVTDALAISGTIINQSGNTTGGITKTGAGTVVFTGANTYTGPTQVTAGVLELNRTVAGQSISASSVITIDNATMRLTGNQFNVLAGNAITIQNGGVLTANSTSNNAHNVGGATGITLSGGTMTSAGGSDGGFGNFVIGTGGVNVIGTAQSTISADSIGWNGTRTFTVADVTAGTDLLVSSVIKDSSGVAALTKAGAGLMNLTGTSANSYTGVTTVSNGVLKISKDAALGTVAGNTSVTSGASLEIAGGLTYSTAEPLSLNGTGVGGAGAFFIDDGGTSSFAGPITIATNATIGAYNGSTLTLTGNINKSGTIVTFLGNGSATNFINLNGVPFAVGPNGAANSDLVVDNVTVNVNSAMDYAGPTSVQNNGILNINSGGSATTTAITVGTAGTGTVNQFAGGNTNVSGNVQVNPGSNYNQSGGTATVGGDVIVAGTYTHSGGTHLINAAGGDLSVSGTYNLQGSGVLDFDDTTGAGPGHHAGGTPSTLGITGAFNFTGGTLQDVTTINPNGTFTQSGGAFIIGENEPDGDPTDNLARTTTINGGFSLLQGGIVYFDAFGPEATTTLYNDAEPIDLLNVTGIANLNGIVDFDDEYGAEFGDVHTLLLAPTINLGPNFAIDGGFFRVVPTGPTGPGFALQAIVPEPASVAVWCLVATCGVVLGARRRKGKYSPQ